MSELYMMTPNIEFSTVLSGGYFEITLLSLSDSRSIASIEWSSNDSSSKDNSTNFILIVSGVCGTVLFVCCSICVLSIIRSKKNRVSVGNNYEIVPVDSSFHSILDLNSPIKVYNLSEVQTCCICFDR